MRRLILITTVGALCAALLSACGSGDLLGGAPTPTWDDARKTSVAERNYQPTRTPIPTSTPRVKATAKSVTVNPTTPAGPDSTPFPTATPNPLNGDFATVLLGVEDLPTGWTEFTTALDLETTPTDDICGTTIQDPAVADIARDFAVSYSGPYVTQMLSLYDSAGNAQAVLLESKRAFESCPPEGWTDEDGSFVYLSPLSFPTIGDDSFALRMTVGEGSRVAEADVVFFQVDEVLAGIVYSAYGAPTSEAFDSTVTEVFARRAEAKIREMTGFIDGLEVPSPAI